MSINPPRSSRAATEDRYREIRTAALRRAEGLAAAALAPTPVRLDAISAAALQAFHDQWEGHPARRYPWPWPTMLDNARRNEPDRFEVSVWSGDTLCGLGIGPTRQKFCRVDFIEGSPDPTQPLKGSIAVVVSGAAVACATATGREEVRLNEPFPALIPRYQALGFELATPKKQTPYCWWKIMP
jgi:hypothetical protein